jgi:murein DD-endopeptidase MepM/ murein hydrolase activator NlpD
LGLYVWTASFVTPSSVFADYPKGCKKVCSPYGARTSCDGRPRTGKYQKPIHHGIDMAVPMGTAIMAVADGVVVASKRLKSIGSIFLMLKHSPEATGLTYHVFSQYFPLREKSPLAIGTAVQMGQTVAFSGKLGNMRHIHLTTRKSSNGRFKGSTFMDPLSFLSAAGTRATWPCQ